MLGMYRLFGTAQYLSVSCVSTLVTAWYVPYRELIDTAYGDVLVILDLRADESLFDAGVAREKLRKKAGLEPTDIVELYYESLEKDEKILEKIVNSQIKVDCIENQPSVDLELGKHLFLSVADFYTSRKTSYKASVPEVLTVPVAYHAVVIRRSLRGPCGEARDVLPATRERRSCPPYPYQIGRMTADPPMRLCQASFNHVGSVTSLGQLSGGARTDLVERPISGTNHGDLAEKVISDTNPGDLAEVRMTSSDSSSSGRVISSSVSGAVSQSDPEASPSGASSGPPSSIDSRALWDPEVMKADHDLDTTVIEGSLALIRERYNILAEYGLHVSQPGHAPSVRTRLVCASRWMLWRPVSVLVCRLKGILSSSRAIKEMTELWLVKADLSPASRDRMDLGELRGMPKVSSGKTPSTRAAVPAREVGASPARETLKASSKRPIDASTEQVDDPARWPKMVKVLTRRHKSRHGEGESRSRSKGKEPAAASEELETPIEFDEGGASPVDYRPMSMKDLFKTKVHKDDAGYYTLHMSDLGYQDPNKEMKARWRGLKNSTKIWNDSSATEEFER
ncbi:hypothetical protein B296_00024918 [Ensete ventricosum]|uniref:Uncharacterized protein n=1 Tax=Ensete ventricosum TaxID=4639 RepID=A0A426ZDF4_ENSVE|nr:hypothetical protein B296_00024918 [Ensete ventricosum]